MWDAKRLSARGSMALLVDGRTSTIHTTYNWIVLVNCDRWSLQRPHLHSDNTIYLLIYLSFGDKIQCEQQYTSLECVMFRADDDDSFGTNACGNNAIFMLAIHLGTWWQFQRNFCLFCNVNKHAICSSRGWCRWFVDFFFFWFFNNFGVQELSWSQRPAVINQDPWSHNIEYPYQYIFVILKK